MLNPPINSGKRGRRGIKRYRANSSAFSADLNKINSELEKGCPVIAGVNYSVLNIML